MNERLAAVAGEWKRMLKEIRCELSDCAGAGLALPFLTATGGTRVMGQFGKFPGAAEIDYSEWSRTTLGIPVALENDLRVALLGEWSAGAARGASDVVMIALGTGIGCAAICDGRLLRGRNNRAATLFGHITVAIDGERARCGNIGCAEDMASTATLPERTRQHPDFKQSLLADGNSIDYERVFKLASAGDRCSEELVADSLRVWSALALNAVVAYDPAMLVIGGGVAREDSVLESIRRHIAEHTPGMRWQVPVVRAELGDDAALLGCERLVLSAREQLP
jgi:glucokinase